ncbi:hypothetical protein HPC49_53880, partial [Pyxidicoccus fallax]
MKRTVIVGAVGVLAGIILTLMVVMGLAADFEPRTGELAALRLKETSAFGADDAVAAAPAAPPMEMMEEAEGGG